MGVQHTVSGSLHLYWFIEQDAILKKHAWPPPFNRLDLDWVTRSPTTCRELAMKKKRAWAARCNQVFCEWSKKTVQKRDTRLRLCWGKPVPMVTGGFRETTSDMHFRGCKAASRDKWAITHTDNLCTCQHAVILHLSHSVWKSFLRLFSGVFLCVHVSERWQLDTQIDIKRKRGCVCLFSVFPYVLLTIWRRSPFLKDRSEAVLDS